MAGRVCTLDGCDREFAARGYCLMHYKRWRNHGDPLVVSDGSRPWTDDDVRAYLDAHIDRSGGSESCHPWIDAPTNAAGYGVLPKPYSRSRLAHRAALAFSLGRPLARGMSARHTCDNPPCCNPAHLLEGTHAQNMNDAYERGRVFRPSQVITHCGDGHELTPDNVRTKRHRSTRGFVLERVCIKCEKRRSSERLARLKAARVAKREETRDVG